LKVFKKKGGFFQMKKIITGIAALAMLTSVFAVDISARLVEKGSIAGGYGSDAYIFGMGKTHQKDDDLLEFAFSGDKAGANLIIWTDLGDEEVLNFVMLHFGSNQLIC
jgi:hypothetical protein